MQHVEIAPEFRLGLAAAALNSGTVGPAAGGRPAPRPHAGSDYIGALLSRKEPDKALRWIAQRVAADLRGRVALLDVSGAAPRTVAGDLGASAVPMSHPDVTAVRDGRLAMASVTSGGTAFQIVPVGDGAVGTILVAADARGTPGEIRPAIARAAWLMGVYLGAQRAQQTEQRLGEVRMRVREAVFDLLRVGNSGAARQVAATIGESLPDPIRMAVLEGVPQRSREAYLGDPESLGPCVWAFRAAGRRDTVILLSPAHQRGTFDDLVAGIVSETGCRVGLSDGVPLRETGIGYEQALHALYAAPVDSRRNERFQSRSKLAYELGPPAAVWAAQLLDPLLRYEPPRRGAPGSDELVHTARIWLRLAQQAPRDLEIHRNTTRDRLRLIGQLVGADLNRVADQSVLSLALRLYARTPDGGLPRDAGPAPELSTLLDQPEAVLWAYRQLRPLLWRCSDVGVQTVRVWLAHDASVAATATAMGVSASAVRKRLLRVSRVLGRALLKLPGARHDLWLALLVYDRSTARVSGGSGPPVPGIPRAVVSQELPNLEVS